MSDFNRFMYVATKAVHAEEMTYSDYCALRGVFVAPTHSGAEEGYLTQCIATKVVEWMSKEQFEKSYRTMEGLSFGMAIEAAKKGMKIARSGWNGKGMWVSISCHESMKVKSENFWNSNNKQYAEENGGFATVLPSFTMKTATGEIQMGWLASQSDMLAEDWIIVP